MSQLTGMLAERFGLPRVVRVAVSGYVTVMMVLFALLFVGYGFGLVIPSTAVLAMDDHGEIAGTASALMGTLQS